jgi:hypothetical protein
LRAARVLAAIRNVGLEFPVAQITLSLARRPKG